MPPSRDMSGRRAVRREERDPRRSGFRVVVDVGVEVELRDEQGNTERRRNVTGRITKNGRTRCIGTPSGMRLQAALYRWPLLSH